MIAQYLALGVHLPQTRPARGHVAVSAGVSDVGWSSVEARSTQATRISRSTSSGASSSGRSRYPGPVRLRLLPLHGQAAHLQRHAGPVHRRRDRWSERRASRVRPQTSPLTARTCPLTRTASGSSTTTAQSASTSPTRTPQGASLRSLDSEGGGFYGYKLDAAVCTATDLPVAWNVRTARDNECIHALPLIDRARERGSAVETCAMDKG